MHLSECSPDCTHDPGSWRYRFGTPVAYLKSEKLWMSERLLNPNERCAVTCAQWEKAGLASDSLLRHGTQTRPQVKGHLPQWPTSLRALKRASKHLKVRKAI
jgi:hypothetical protein